MSAPSSSAGPSRSAGPSSSAGPGAVARDRDAGPNIVDHFLDDLLPGSVDWRHIVRQYPHAALAAALAAGFWLGHRKSKLVLAAVGSYFAAQVGDAVVDLRDASGRD